MRGMHSISLVFQRTLDIHIENMDIRKEHVNIYKENMDIEKENRYIYIANLDGLPVFSQADPQLFLETSPCRQQALSSSEGRDQDQLLSTH